MGLSCGLIGVPSCGKTVIYNAVTAAGASTYSGSEMNRVMVNVPDRRLERLAEMYHPRKVTPADVTYADVAGLGLSRERGVSGELLTYLGRADALLLVVDLSVSPLAQMDELTPQLENMRIGIVGIGVRSADSILTEKKALVVGNKLDLPDARQNYTALQHKYGSLVIGVSAKNGTGLEELKARIFQLLDVIRVYTKAPGQKPDLTDPMVLPRGSTVEQAAEAVHKDFRAQLKYARLWGSGKHDGLNVKRDHVLQDGDVIELHL